MATVAATPEAIAADHDLRSPKSTVSTFLAAMEPSDGRSNVARATKALDTSELPELVREEGAQDIAVKLYAILTYKDITAAKVPSSIAVNAIQIGDVGDHSIYLEQSGPNWRFSKATVKDVPDMFRDIEHNLSRKEMRKLGGSTAAWMTIRSYVPEALKHTTLLIEDWHWIAAFITLLIAIALHYIVVFFTRSVLNRMIPARFAAQPAATIAYVRKPIFVIVFTTAVQLLLSTFDLQIDVYTFAITWISTIRIIALMILAIRLIHLFSDRVNRLAAGTISPADEILYPLLEKASWLCVIVIGAVQILWIHGVNVSGLAAGLGLGGLAFALAAKDTVENIFGAVAILIDQPFRVGDNISMGGLSGTVEHIGLRSTRLRTPENSLVSLPNSKIIASHVDNLGARSAVRVKFVLNLPFSTPPATIEALCAGIRTVVSSHPLCVRDSAVVNFNEFNATTLGVLVQFHLALNSWVEEQQRREEIFLAVLRLVNELGVQLAVPTQEVTMKQADTNTQPQEPLSAAKGIEAAKKLKLTWSV
jgi:MscS family membrane protein